MTRLGWPAIWLSAVSEDPLGDLVVELVGGAGVDVSRVRRDPDHRTGVFFKVRQDGQSRVLYYRRGSAASYFDPFAGEEAWLKSHVSVIKAYPPFGDRYVKYGLPVIGYHDPATEGFAPLEPSQIKAYVAEVERDASVGYAGVFVDDANWSFSPSPGPAEHLANLHHLRAVGAVGGNLEHRQLTGQGLRWLQVADLQHVDQLVQLLGDLVDRMQGAVERQRDS